MRLCRAVPITDEKVRMVLLETEPRLLTMVLRGVRRHFVPRVFSDDPELTAGGSGGYSKRQPGTDYVKRADFMQMFDQSATGTGSSRASPNSNSSGSGSGSGLPLHYQPTGMLRDQGDILRFVDLFVLAGSELLDVDRGMLNDVVKKCESGKPIYVGQQGGGGMGTGMGFDARPLDASAFQVMSVECAQGGPQRIACLSTQLAKGAQLTGANAVADSRPKLQGLFGHFDKKKAEWAAEVSRKETRGDGDEEI